MNDINKHLKFGGLYAGIIYGIGFLILSTRLASLNIFIKDFFTLDYIKAGLLFVFINLPIYIIANELKEKPKAKINKILFYFFTLLGCLSWIVIVSSFLFDNRENRPLHDFILTMFIYPIIIYLFSITLKKVKFENIKIEGIDLGVRFIFALVVITFFSTIIFPKIKFRFGGGAPYQKVLIVKNTSNSIDKINATIYYENDNWIHYIDETNLVISMPKKEIIRTESKLENDFIINNLK